jgi:hypothetical protein
VEKTLTKFQKTAYGGRFRRDGKLLVAGGEEGIVRYDLGEEIMRVKSLFLHFVHSASLCRVFELNSRIALKAMAGHKGYLSLRLSHA